MSTQSLPIEEEAVIASMLAELLRLFAQHGVQLEEPNEAADETVAA